MSQYEGGCGCGAVRYRLEAPPLVTHCCHCRNCQRQTGSAFVINLLVETDRLRITQGDPVGVGVPRDDGTEQLIVRCPACQVAVYSHYGSPRAAFVRAGTLDDPTAVTPDIHIFTRSKLPWIAIPDGAAAFDAYYDETQVWPAESLARLAALRARGSGETASGGQGA